MQVREDARVRAAESFCCGDFGDAVEWLRHFVQHDAILYAEVSEQFARLVRDATFRGEVDLATAALDYATEHRLLSRREILLLRAGTRIIGGDVAGGLTLALPLLVDRDDATILEVTVNLDALARYLEAVGRGDLAAQYRRQSADLTWVDTLPAYAVGEMPGICAQSPMHPDPMPPRIATFCQLVVADGVFAVPYLPYTAFTGRTVDGAEDLAAFDELCEQVEKALAPLDHGSLPLYAVPVDDAALHAFAAHRELDPHEVWTGTLWAGQQAKAGHGTPWPPEPHEPCWCGRPLRYDDCCRQWRH